MRKAVPEPHTLHTPIGGCACVRSGSDLSHMFEHVRSCVCGMCRPPSRLEGSCARLPPRPFMASLFFSSPVDHHRPIEQAALRLRAVTDGGERSVGRTAANAQSFGQTVSYRLALPIKNP
jgi:hypothetical protein